LIEYKTINNNFVFENNQFIFSSRIFDKNCSQNKKKKPHSRIKNMFDAERMLGKIVTEFMGSGGKKKKKKGKNALLGSLTSGAGLMTAIGLGIGAYEILRDKQASASGQQQYSPPPPPTGSTGSAMPPPVPPRQNAQANNAPPPPLPSSPVVPATVAAVEQQVAIRIMQVMIAAAHADGTLDSEEEEKILARAAKAGLTPEEKHFLLVELHSPKSIVELTSGVNDPGLAKALYMAAVSSIGIDTPEERTWLDQLAGALGLSKAIQAFIEDEQ
jgi:uncharacterized membrane protein YebE (DUF533 family)